MERSSKLHMDETMNLRSFYLRLLRKIWIVPLMAVTGAIIAGGIYTLVSVTFGPQKTYSAQAKMYLNFAYDEDTGSLVDWYNAYTWNMLMTTDDIFNVMIDELKEKGVTVVEGDGPSSATGDGVVITRDELASYITAEIPSDIRVMLLTAESPDGELSDAIIEASVSSMENYGRINEAFDSIKNLSITKASLVTYSNKTITAAIFGAIIALVASVLLLLLWDAVDDAVYVPEDCEKRYRLPVLGVLFDEKVDFFRNELIAAIEKITAPSAEIAVISVDSIKDDVVSKEDTRLLLDNIEGALGENDRKFIPMAVPGSDLDNYRKISTCDGVILCVPYGKRKGAMAEHVIGQLTKHECPILGIILVRADKKFVASYYGIKEKVHG